MRKKMLILVLLVLLPAAVFAELGIGGAAFYKSPVLFGQSVDTDNRNVDQFSFGANARFKLTLFQAEALLLLSVGDVNGLDIFLDAGVALDIAIVRLSFGAGPNFTYNFGESSPLRAGLNAKAGADLMLGPISAGMSYIMALDMTDGIDIETGSGLLGFQVLFWL
jgi:hypothetical protein